MPGDLEYNQQAPSGAEEMLTAIQDREKTYKEEDLTTDLNWLEASAKVYEMNNDGEKFSGNPQALAKYGIDQMSEFNYNVSLGTIPDVMKVEKADHDTQVAFAYMMDTYDKKDITLDGVGRALKETMTDPLTYVGISTLGAGLAVKKGAQYATKEGFKNRLHGAIRSYLTSGLAVGATEGALYTAGDEVARESVYQDADLMDGYSGTNIAASGAIGAVAGAGLVKGIEVAGKGIGKGIDYVRKQGEEAMAQVAGGGTPPISLQNATDVSIAKRDDGKFHIQSFKDGNMQGEHIVSSDELMKIMPDNYDKVWGNKEVNAGMFTNFKVEQKNKRIGLDQHDMIYNGDTEQVARERYDIPNLPLISKGGSDRQVFDLGGDKALKVAKTARGLQQNEVETDGMLAGSILPKVYETGQNYHVTEKVNFVDKRKEINALTKFLQSQNINRNNRKDAGLMYAALSDAEEKFGIDGLSDLGNYDLLWGDITAARNWGVGQDGRIVLADGGSISEDILDVSSFAKNDWEKIKREIKRIKKEHGDLDKYMASLGGLTLLQSSKDDNKKETK